MEWAILNEAKDYIEREMKIPVNITKSDDSDHPKAKVAIPRRPGINMELV
jgi:hypothetical protein